MPAGHDVGGSSDDDAFVHIYVIDLSDVLYMQLFSLHLLVNPSLVRQQASLRKAYSSGYTELTTRQPPSSCDGGIGRHCVADPYFDSFSFLGDSFSPEEALFGSVRGQNALVHGREGDFSSSRERERERERNWNGAQDAVHFKRNFLLVKVSIINSNSNTGLYLFMLFISYFNAQNINETVVVPYFGVILRHGNCGNRSYGL